MTGYDVIVVGAGSVGMSTGYQLAKRGARTLLIDAFDPPHTEGSHHGEPRLIRHAYSGGEAYLSLALRADRLWEELQEETGEPLLIRSGVLNLADRELYSWEARAADGARFGVAVELLDSGEIRKRWPGLAAPDHFGGMYEPRAGYLHSERCVAAYRKLALACGAELAAGTPVTGITARPGSVTVHTGQGDYQAASAVLSVGAWFGTLDPFIQLPIRAVRKTVGWFETESADYDAGRFPGFTIGTREGGFYGFPNIDGAGVKIGRHDGGASWSLGEQPAAFGAYPEDERELRRTLERYLPLAAGRLLRSAVCKYELSPDEGFILDRHPGHPHILLAGGLSGHGFKFASAIGEALAEWTLEGRPGRDLSAFRLSRFA